MKFFLVLALALASSVHGLRRVPNARFPVQPLEDDTRIVGGSEADPQEFPWQISLQSLLGSHSCGGSVLNTRTALCAAHCVVGNNANDNRILAGSNDRHNADGTGQYAFVSEFKFNSEYNANTFENDISVILLANELMLDGTFVKAVTLPDKTHSEDADGTWFTVTGWGTEESGGACCPDKLMKVDVPYVSDSICNDTSHYRGGIYSHMICAGKTGIDSCQGDSGGPMVINGTETIVGIVSWGFGCAAPNRPGVYTQVSYFIDWITSNMA